MTLNRVLLNFCGGKVHSYISHRIINYPEWDGTHKDRWRSAPGPAQDTCRTHTRFRATDILEFLCAIFPFICWMVEPGSPAVLLPWHGAHEHFRVHGRSWLLQGTFQGKACRRRMSLGTSKTEENSLAGMGRKSQLQNEWMFLEP